VSRPRRRECVGGWPGWFTPLWFGAFALAVAAWLAYLVLTALAAQ
jgi:hypothetical protein